MPATSAAALPTKRAIVFDAERDPCEQVLALVERVGLVEERVAEALLDRGHAVTSRSAT